MPAFLNPQNLHSISWPCCQAHRYLHLWWAQLLYSPKNIFLWHRLTLDWWWRSKELLRPTHQSNHQSPLHQILAINFRYIKCPTWTAELVACPIIQSNIPPLQSTLYKCYTYKYQPSLNVNFLLLPTYCTL